MAGFRWANGLSQLLGKCSRLATVFSRTDIFSPHPSNSLGTNYKGREFYRSLAGKPEQPSYSSPQTSCLIRKPRCKLRTCNKGVSLTLKIGCPTLGLGAPPRFLARSNAR